MVTSAVADRDLARRVLETEATAVLALVPRLDARFDRAIELLRACRGRVIVTGMGKSGIICRKIAATLASTGTPAHFVHPAEASHGDLGMITAGDAVIALSNSGETAEIADLITHCRRFTIPLIAFVGNAQSTLGRNADCVLALPRVPEACPLGLAPTTSTTMMLALGDALAVALLDKRGFSKESFQQLHPGGKLGRKLVRVSDLHHSGDAVPLVGVDTTMKNALLEMTAKSFGCVGVIDAKGKLLGIITDGDLRRLMERAVDTLTLTAADVMTRNPATVGPRTQIGRAHV